MKHLKVRFVLAALAAGLVLLFPGCATRNVNPPRARAQTGYVDFHGDNAADLMWEVTRWEERTGRFERVFVAYEPLKERVLRVPFAPGQHRLRVTFYNRVIASPTEVAVEVQDGKITPILVTLAEAGSTAVETKRVSGGGTVYGRAGRTTRFSTGDAGWYTISAVAEPITPYQPKDQMPYGR